MVDINLQGKYEEELNVGNMNNRVDQNNPEKLSNQSIRTPLGEPVNFVTCITGGEGALKLVDPQHGVRVGVHPECLLLG